MSEIDLNARSAGENLTWLNWCRFGRRVLAGGDWLGGMNVDMFMVHRRTRLSWRRSSMHYDDLLQPKPEGKNSLAV